MTEQQISVVDDDAGVRDSIYALLETAGFAVRTYASAKRFLADYIPNGGCLIADIRMPEMGGLELQEEITRRGMELPVILITDHADVPLAVRAMKAGAVDFIEKPFDDDAMIASVEGALRIGQRSCKRAAEMKLARDTLALLTSREQHVLAQLVKGRSNKVAAHELGISPRTVEFHRARIMDKLNVHSMSDLLRIALMAEQAMLDDVAPVPKWRGSSTAIGRYTRLPNYTVPGAKG